MSSKIECRKGISAIESLAVGTPIIVPEHGVFPELIADTRGGVLFEAENPTSLAEALARQLSIPHEALERGLAGQARVQQHFTADRMARETLQLYTTTLQAADKG